MTCRAACFLALASTLAGQQPSAELNRGLPSWIETGGEYRMRFEGFSGFRFQENADDHYVLNRVRLNLRLQPFRQVRIFAQAQDARVFSNSRIADGPPYQDSMDLRQAWAEFGNSDKSPVALRVGRQEINSGDERLLGSGNWGNTSRTFDAVRLILRRSRVRFDVFAASVVAQTDGSFDRHVDGDDLHGVMAQVDLGKHRIEPYGFWRLAPRVRAETGPLGKLDTKTAGIRWTGPITRTVSGVTEMIVQGGNWGADTVRSWAGHWRIQHPTADRRFAPRMRYEYNYATGDRDPADGRHGTFELLYPTPHDKYGLADQVGWKNLHHIGTIAEWKVPAKWTWQVKYHHWWLASARDGLYNAGGVLLARDPTGRSGRHIGQEVDVQVLSTLTKTLLLGGGVGHLFPGAFIQRTTQGASYTFPYVMLTWAF